MNKIKFKTRKETSEFLKTKGIDTSDWSEEKWQSINTSQAEIHIQALAEAMWDQLQENTPRELKAGEWHIPFGNKIDNEVSKWGFLGEDIWGKDNTSNMIKVATARCARLSYMTFDGEIDYEKDIKLHDRLLASKHMSCFEHCARAMSEEEYYSFVKGQVPTSEDIWGILNYEYYPLITAEDSAEYFGLEKGPNPNNGDRYGWCNNFKGFIQYRYLVE